MYYDDDDDGFFPKSKEKQIAIQRVKLGRTYDRVSVALELLSNIGHRFDLLIEFNARDRFAHRYNHAIDRESGKEIPPENLSGLMPMARDLAQAYWRVTNDAPPEYSLPQLDHMLSADLRESIGERAIELTHKDPDRRRGIGMHISYLRDPDDDGWQYCGYLVRYARKAIEALDTHWGVYYKPATAEVKLGEYRRPDYAHMEVIPFTQDGLFALMEQAKASILKGNKRFDAVDLYNAPDTWESYLSSRNKSGYGLVGQVRERGEKGRKWDVWYNHETGERFIRRVGLDEWEENARIGVTRFTPRRAG